jgi:hypothetical protein
MGLSIYYSGELRDSNLIDDIIEEAADIADSMQWSVTELPSVPDIPLRGIVIQPENCDPLWLTFHANGKLFSPILFSYLIEREDPKAVEEAQQVLVTKTQYAGAEIHMAVIKFFRYLSEKYFSSFELHDESKFWETGDEVLCRKRFGDGGRVMEIFDIAFAEFESHPERKDEMYRKLKEMLKDEGYYDL